MIVHKMTVDGTEYFLDPSQNVDETKSLVVDAVKRGGAVVDIQTAGHSTVSILVSQSTPVTFETVEAEDPGEHDPGDDLWDWDFLLS
jgi:hypothetical protein